MVTEGHSLYMVSSGVIYRGTQMGSAPLVKTISHLKIWVGPHPKCPHDCIQNPLVKIFTNHNWVLSATNWNNLI